MSSKEVEKLFKEQEEALAKAAPKSEEPPKAKHIRSAVITTWEHRSGHIFWSALLKMPLGSHPAMCYKSEIIVHKLLHDGHPSVLPETFRQKGKLLQLGQIWASQHSPYSAMISTYVKFLVAKLDFHHKYQSLPGDLNTELDSFGPRRYDAASAFTFVTDVFDLHDRLLECAASILGSLNLKLNQDQTELRIYALVPISWESRALYFVALQLLQLLHKDLDSATLAGHDARFVEQWYKLKKLYFDINNLKFLKGQVNLPDLGDEPPAWAVQKAGPPKPKPVEDKFKGFGNFDGAVSFGPSADLEAELARLREEVRRLLAEMERLRAEIARLLALLAQGEAEQAEHDRSAAKARGRFGELEKVMEEQAARLKELEEAYKGLASKEEELKSAQHRFDKMSEMYTKLRADHLNLLKSNAAQKKAFDESEKKTKEAEEGLEALTPELELLRSEKERLESMNAELASQNKTAAEMATKFKAEISAKEQSLQDDMAAARAAAAAAAKKLQEDMDAMVRDLAMERELAHMARTEAEDAYRSLLDGAVDTSQAMLQRAVAEFASPEHLGNQGCTAEYTITSAESVKDAAKTLANVMAAFLKNMDKGLSGEQLSTLPMFSSAMADLLHNSKGSLRLAADNSQADRVRAAVNQSATKAHGLLEELRIREGESFPDRAPSVEKRGIEMAQAIDGVIAATDAMIVRAVGAEQLGEALKEKMDWAARVVAESGVRLDTVITRAGEEQTGLQLNVNESIVAGSKALMDCIKLLVDRAGVVQTEIVEKGRGGATPSEFYRQNHTWTEGLITGAGQVGTGAQTLVEAAEGAVLKGGKYDSLISAANEIMNSTSGLVAAARMKADRGSKAQERLEGASKDVRAATRELVKAAKNASEIMAETNKHDYSRMSDDAAKRAEMQKQIRALELERELELARKELDMLRAEAVSRDDTRAPDAE